MSDSTKIPQQWNDWVVQACEIVDVSPDVVDIPTVLTLTRQIAHGFERPMAPVGAYILGVAVGHLQEQGRPVDIELMRRAITETIHAHSRSQDQPDKDGV